MLASHGYIVFSVDHTGFSLTTVFPDGYTFINDALKMPEPTGGSRNDALASWKYLEDRPFSIWVRDIIFVLDEIRKLNDTPGEIFNGRLDLKKTGSLGWSFGGAASVQAAIFSNKCPAPTRKWISPKNRIEKSGEDHPVGPKRPPAAPIFSWASCPPSSP